MRRQCQQGLLNPGVLSPGCTSQGSSSSPSMISKLVVIRSLLSSQVGGPLEYFRNRAAVMKRREEIYMIKE